MRRLIPAAAALVLFAAQAPAQTQPDATQAPAAGAASPAPANPAAPMAKKHRSRQTLQQRFDAANTTHDGHLTKDQAAAANWPYVTNNFAAIDKDKKGYVTVSDIHAFAKARHAARHKTTPTPASSTSG